jgi:two-component sensor histidine kinase
VKKSSTIKKRKIPRRAAARKPVLSKCRALMIVDSSRIRKDSLKEFKRTRTSFKKAEKELSIFENEDQPAYQKWYRTELGPLHEEIKQVCEKIEALKSKMIRIQELAERKGWALQVATSLFELHPSEFERIERDLEETFQRIIDGARRRAEERSAHKAKVILDRLRQFLNNNKRTIAKLLKNVPSPGLATMTVLDKKLLFRRFPVMGRFR